MVSPLDLLRRSDKLSLGGGRLCLWAPEFPRWADTPGFWDQAAFLEHAVEPLFTVTILDERGLPAPTVFMARGWSPARLSQSYRARAGAESPHAFPAPGVSSSINLRVQEDRALSPEDVFISSLAITNLHSAPQKLTLVLWTAQPRGLQKDGLGLVMEGEKLNQTAARLQIADFGLPSTPQSAIGNPQSIRFSRQLPGGGIMAEHTIAFCLGADRAPASFSIHHSEWSTGRANHPRWELTPFFEWARVADGFVQLPNQAKLTGGPRGDAENTLLYLALAYPLEVAPEATEQITFGCALAPREEEARVNFEAAVRPSPLAPLSTRERGGGEGPAPLARCQQNWQAYFEGLPEFHCSDPYIEKYFYYRYFGLRLNAVDTQGRFNLPRPGVFEGINTGWFRHQISYSAQVHMREARWLPDPALAQGSLENFTASQRADGSFVGGILTGPGAQIGDDFIYHADWGGALRALHAVHPDVEFLRRVYPALVRYAGYYKREHDRENMHLYDVRNQAETGQEYMARYQFVDPQGDRWGELNPRLKGVDATIYAYNLFRCLEWLAPLAGDGGDSAGRPYADEADAIAAAIRERMWDPEVGFFFDVNPATGQRCPTKVATGFYPFLTDIPGPEHLRAFDHLFNPGEFWTPCPLPATSLDDPSFSAEGEWKDRRHVCPWNGRAWLMTTSHVAQALAHTAGRFGESPLRERAAELIRRYIHSLYLDHDLARPTSFEYYNPLTGAAPFFRATDDYMHSWIADLIVQFVVGLQPGEGATLVVQPLPFGLEHFSLRNARVKGHTLSIVWDFAAGLSLRVDGVEQVRQTGLARVEISLPRSD